MGLGGGVQIRPCTPLSEEGCIVWIVNYVYLLYSIYVCIVWIVNYVYLLYSEGVCMYVL